MKCQNSEIAHYALVDDRPWVVEVYPPCPPSTHPPSLSAHLLPTPPQYQFQ